MNHFLNNSVEIIYSMLFVSYICLFNVYNKCVAGQSVLAQRPLCIYRIISSGHAQDLFSGDETANTASRLYPHPSHPWKHRVQAAAVSTIFFHVSSKPSKPKSRWPDSIPNSHTALSTKISGTGHVRGRFTLLVLFTCLTWTWGTIPVNYIFDVKGTCMKEKNSILGNVKIILGGGILGPGTMLFKQFCVECFIEQNKLYQKPEAHE